MTNMDKYAQIYSLFKRSKVDTINSPEKYNMYGSPT